MEIIGIGRNHANKRVNQNEETNSKSISKIKPIKSHSSKALRPDTEELLQTALCTGSIEQYNEALLLERYRDALVEHARTLQEDISVEVSQKVKELTPKTYGWKGFSIRKPMEDPDCFEADYRTQWETIRHLEAQQHPLEDEHISQEFFNDLKDALIGRDISSLSKNLIRTHAPWLLGKKDTNSMHRKVWLLN
jgi:hypothetical protein